MLCWFSRKGGAHLHTFRVCLLKSISNIRGKGWRNVPNDCTALWSMQAAAWICRTHGKQYCGQYPDQERKRCHTASPVVIIYVIGSQKLKISISSVDQTLKAQLGLFLSFLCKRKLCYIGRGKKRRWNTIWGEKQPLVTDRWWLDISGHVCDACVAVCWGRCIGWRETIPKARSPHSSSFPVLQCLTAACCHWEGMAKSWRYPRDTPVSIYWWLLLVSSMRLLPRAAGRALKSDPGSAMQLLLSGVWMRSHSLHSLGLEKMNFAGRLQAGNKREVKGEELTRTFSCVIKSPIGWGTLGWLCPMWSAVTPLSPLV